MDAAIVAVIAAILGALVGACITYYFSRGLAKQQIFNQTAVRFRAAFTDELTKLTTSSNDPYDILKNAKTKHIAARIEFQWVLTDKEQQRFDLAWQKYYCAEQDPKVPFLEKYSKHLSEEQSGIPKQDRRQTAIARIEALVELAKTK